MSTQDPYAPLKSAAPGSLPTKRHAGHFVLLALVVLQVLFLVRYSWAYFELFRTGAVSPLKIGAVVVGCVLLYLATLFVIFNPRNGRALFFTSGIVLALVMPFGEGFFGLYGVVVFGTLLSGVGVWLVTKTRRALLTSAAADGYLVSQQDAAE